VIPIKAEIETLFRKLKPIYGNRVERLYRAYQLEDAEGRAEIEQKLRQLHLQSIKKGVDDDQILLVPPPPQSVQGPYPIGKVLYNGQEQGTFGLREEEWCQHLALFGRSGSGKTNTAYYLIGTLLRNKKPFLILDWKKNFRPLTRLSEQHEILVFTVGKPIAPFRFNPLIPPPGCEPSSYLKKLIDVIGESTYVGEGVQFLLQEAMDSLYRKHGVYSGKAETYPTLRDVFEAIETRQVSSRARDWMASTRRALGALCFGEMGRVVETQSNTALEELLRKNVVLELDSLTSMDKSFLIQSLLLWIHHYRMNIADRDKFDLAIILEEAHHILRRQSGTNKESIVELLLREVREFGVSITLIDQSPSLISPVALANTYTTFTMGLKSDADVRTAANYLLMDTEERKVLGQLPTGQAIVKLQGRWFKPFLIQVPYAPLKDSPITDQALRRHMRRYYSQTPLKPPPNPKRTPPADVSKPEKGTQNEISAEDTSNNKVFLQDIFEHPFSSMTERYRRLELNRRRGNDLKEHCLVKQFIQAVEIPMRTGRTVLLKLTDSGIAQIKNNIEQGRLGHYLRTRQCLVHEYWKHKLAEYYKGQGYEVRVEEKINGEVVDLELRKDNQRTAVEIETGKSDYRKNIKKALTADFDNILCIATENRVANQIKRAIETHFTPQKDQIQVLSVTDFTLS